MPRTKACKNNKVWLDYLKQREFEEESKRQEEIKLDEEFQRLLRQGSEKSKNNYLQIQDFKPVPIGKEHQQLMFPAYKDSSKIWGWDAAREEKKKFKGTLVNEATTDKSASYFEDDISRYAQLIGIPIQQVRRYDRIMKGMRRQVQIKQEYNEVNYQMVDLREPSPQVLEQLLHENVSFSANLQEDASFLYQVDMEDYEDPYIDIEDVEMPHESTCDSQELDVELRCDNGANGLKIDLQWYVNYLKPLSMYEVASNELDKFYNRK